MDASPDASFGTLDLDEGMLGLIKPELAPGERLLWAARSFPKRRVLLGSEAVSVYWALGLFGLSVVLFFALSWSQIRSGAGEGLFIILGTISAAAGLIVGIHAIGNVVARLVRERRTVGEVYAITDRRAIFWGRGDTPGAIEVSILPRGTILATAIRRTQYPDGSGDLHLSDYQYRGKFRGVAHVRSVENLVRTHLVADHDETIRTTDWPD
ncbi:hypothetical protein TA3x_002308 [Tundrisphaera sp. TA3]|uniref:hypothetical protein n=1 Tax=Tundrisphaera sp. TA3 TaxID=3435775 RepID=UPI003EB8EDDB